MIVLFTILALFSLRVLHGYLTAGKTHTRIATETPHKYRAACAQKYAEDAAPVAGAGMAAAGIDELFDAVSSVDA